MKRTPFKRGTKPLKRKTRLKVRGKSRFPKRRDPKFLQYVREQDCILQARAGSRGYTNVGYHVCGFYPDRPIIEPAHLKTRGSGGGDLGNVVSLCPKAHDEQEGRTAEFELKYNVDLKREAGKIEDRYLASRADE